MKRPDLLCSTGFHLHDAIAVVNTTSSANF